MEYKYICEKCNYKTNLKTSFRLHNNSVLHLTGKRKIRKDKQNVEFICENCKYKTSTKNNFDLHKLNNHSTKEEKKIGFKYYCEKCDFGTFGKSYYDHHLLTEKHINKTV